MMQQLTQQWQQWQQQFLLLPQGRRKFWFALAVAVVVYLGVWLVLLPTQEQLATERQIQRQQQQQISIFEQELAAVRARLAGDPKAELKSRRGQLQERLDRLEAQLNAEANYISASDNKALLRALLDSASGIKVQSAQALPPERVYQDAQDDTTAIYKHRLQLSVTGDFFAVRNYLNRLEQLDWNFYWQKLDYRVKQAPQAEVTIEIYTLSLERDYVAS